MPGKDEKGRKMEERNKRKEIRQIKEEIKRKTNMESKITGRRGKKHGKEEKGRKTKGKYMGGRKRKEKI